MDVNEFIVKAKKSTYASGAKSKILDDGFEELTYKEGDLFYRDRWKGSNPFCGEEIIMHKGKIVWLMNYYGAVFSSVVASDDVYTFLRKAMRLVDEQRPFRGPAHFKEGDFEYIDKSTGIAERFRGTERIIYQGKEVYRLDYHGGNV